MKFISIYDFFNLYISEYISNLLFSCLSNVQAFNVVFEKAIDKAEPAEEVKDRVVNLIDCITFSVFVYTSRGLFERDKLTFVTQMTTQVSHDTHLFNNCVY